MAWTTFARFTFEKETGITGREGVKYRITAAQLAKIMSPTMEIYLMHPPSKEALPCHAQGITIRACSMHCIYLSAFCNSCSNLNRIPVKVDVVPVKRQVAITWVLCVLRSDRCTYLD